MLCLGVVWLLPPLLRQGARSWEKRIIPIIPEGGSGSQTGITSSLVGSCHHSLYHPPNHHHHSTMTTIPARLAKPALVSTSLEQTRKRAIQAYREWYRSAPEIVTLYMLPVSPNMVRIKVRQDFERNRHVENVDVINMLLLKNQQEFQETMNGWKQQVSQISGGRRVGRDCGQHGRWSFRFVREGHACYMPASLDCPEYGSLSTRRRYQPPPTQTQSQLPPSPITPTNL